MRNTEGSHTYPTAMVQIQLDGQDYEREVAVASQLPEDVLLGTDVPLTKHFIKSLTADERQEALEELTTELEGEKSLVMTTRSRSKGETVFDGPEGETTHTPTVSDTRVDRVLPNELVTTCSPESAIESGTTMEEEYNSDNPVFPFSQELFEPPGKTRTRTTRAERRRHNRQRTEVKTGLSREELIREQAADPDIQHWWENEKPCYRTKIAGVLCRRWRPRDRPAEVCDQIVLPHLFRPNVLAMAHDIPMAGHLGRERTLHRVRKRFWWPSIVTDVREYCQSCPPCQRVARKPTRVPMVPLPVIGEPFRRIAMDMVGPLPRTAGGHRFILVVCDYATRYPEAFPLRDATAPRVAEKLLELFSRHGIPHEILTDQGTNFTSALLKELYRLLGTKSITTSPYHPQTDGLVERFNQTLKLMLRKTLQTERRSWDKLIPLVLFAYRDVPQETTGFSPFEMVYSRDPRGPLDVLHSAWIPQQEETDDIAKYVLRVRERMEAAQEAVTASVERAQQKQKTWYDRTARERQYQVGDKVMLLLPDSTQKFQTEWRGPYVVKKRTGPVTYEIELPERGCGKIFHCNLLKEWHD